MIKSKGEICFIVRKLKLKKKLVVLLVVVLILPSMLFVTACGRNSKKFVAVFLYSLTDSYILELKNNMEELFDGTKMNVKFYDAERNQTTQNSQITTAISKGADLLVVNIVDRNDEPANIVVSKAKNANIPIIFFNREVTDSVIKSYEQAYHVGFDSAYFAENLQGEVIFESLKNDWNATTKKFKTIELYEGKIPFVQFRGEIGSLDLGLLMQSVVKANSLLQAAEMPTLIQIGLTVHEYFRAEVKYKMETLLNNYPLDGSAGPKIQIVVAQNDDIALGVIDALENYGHYTGSNSKIRIFGIEGTSEARESIRAGRLTGTVYSNIETLAELVVKMTENILDGKDVLLDLNYTFVSYVNKIYLDYDYILG